MLITKDYNGWTALHWSALALGEKKFRGPKGCHVSGQFAGHLHRHAICQKSNCRGWSALLRDVLSAVPLRALHDTENEGKTPLCVLLTWFHSLPKQARHWNKDAKMIQHLNCLLYTWIYDLKGSGIDLQEYGKMETALRFEDKVNASCRSSYRGGKFHLLGFSYGPEVEDWKFWFSEPTDYLAGRLWARVEQNTSKTARNMLYLARGERKLSFTSRVLTVISSTS